MKNTQQQHDMPNIANKLKKATQEELFQIVVEVLISLNAGMEVSKDLQQKALASVADMEMVSEESKVNWIDFEETLQNEIHQAYVCEGANRTCNRIFLDLCEFIDNNVNDK